MRIGLGDITPLNLPTGATEQVSQPPQGGYILGPSGWWIWAGSPGSSPTVQIPLTSGPGVPANQGWVLLPNNTVIWTGPGTHPSTLPPSITPPNSTVQLMPPAVGQMHDWSPQPILPDSMQPPAIQRSNPLIAPAQWTRNKWDYEILARARKWEWVAKNGGLKSCCRIPEAGRPIWNEPPWQVMPDDGYEYQQMLGLPLSAFQDPANGAFTGDNVLITSIQVPSGYDGVINRFVAGVSNQTTGYNDFSGNVFWRLEYGIRYAKSLGNVQNTFGSFAGAFEAGVNVIRVISGQTIQLFANIPAGSPIAGGTINAGVFGWFYPRR